MVFADAGSNSELAGEGWIDTSRYAVQRNLDSFGVRQLDAALERHGLHYKGRIRQAPNAGHHVFGAVGENKSRKRWEAE